MVRTAVVRGTGSIGARHLRVLRSLGVKDLLAVPVRPGRASSSVLGDARIVDALPSDPDLVVVATDTARHARDAIEALDAGAGVVIVEKPLTATRSQAAELLAHPRADRVRVSAPLRFTEALGKTRGLLDDLPSTRSARIVSQSWLPDWRPDRNYADSYSARPGEGGVLLDLVHEIDYALWLFGPPWSVRALVSPQPSPVLGLEVDEAADLLWRAGGTHVSIRLDYTTRPTRRSLDVTSSEGRVTWDALTGRLDLVRAEGRPHSWAFPRDLDRDLLFARQTRALVALLEGQDDERLVGLEAALAAVSVTESARADRDPSEEGPA